MSFAVTWLRRRVTQAADDRNHTQAEDDPAKPPAAQDHEHRGEEQAEADEQRRGDQPLAAARPAEPMRVMLELRVVHCASIVARSSRCCSDHHGGTEARRRLLIRGDSPQSIDAKDI